MSFPAQIITVTPVATGLYDGQIQVHLETNECGAQAFAHRLHEPTLIVVLPNCDDDLRADLKAWLDRRSAR